MKDYLLNIRVFIEENNITKASLYSELGIARKSLDNYLSGKTNMTVEILNSLCGILDVNICEVLTKDFSHGNEFSKYEIDGKGQELEVVEPQSQKDVGKDDNKYLQSEVEELRSDKKFLQNSQNILYEQLKIKDNQIENLHDVINSQLPSKHTG